MTSLRRLALDRIAALRQQAPYIPRAFRLVWEPCRGLTVAWLGLVLIQGLLPAVSVVLTKRLVDGLIAVLRSGGAWDDVRSCVFPGALMALAVLADDLVSAVSRYVRSAQAQAATQHIERLVHQKSVSVDLAFYDSAEYYDRLHRARADAASTPLELLASLGSLLRSIVTLLATCGVLMTYAWWVPITVVMSTLPALYLALHYILAEYRLTISQTAENRRCRYYDDLLTSNANAAEVRLFGIGEGYGSLYQTLRGSLRRDRLRLVRRSVILQLLSATYAVLLMAGTLVWFALKAIQGRYTLGDLALLYQAYWKGQELLAALHGSVGAVYRNMLYLNNLFEFLDMESSLTQQPDRRPPRALAVGTGIEFHDVTFCYPGSARPALRRFNLRIRAGETVAIVGENGAGKSTLAKLLCRFYDPQEGRITIDGVDLRDLPLESVRATFSVLFQQPVHYNESVTSNVSVSTAHAVSDAESIRRAIHKAGADAIVDRLPRGAENVLGRMFEGGAELSAGEWQRIGLARAYLREAPILILDEPTSAMDPWSEAEWLRQLQELERTRTTVIISHRFSVAMHATRIHVIHDGGVVESGTHAELMARHGKYAAGWQTLLVEAQ